MYRVVPYEMIAGHVFFGGGDNRLVPSSLVITLFQYFVIMSCKPRILSVFGDLGGQSDYLWTLACNVVAISVSP